MNTLTVTLVRSEDGSVDFDASTDAFVGALQAHIAERETETATIAAAVSTVFDQLDGARGNMKYLVSAATQQLNATPDNFKTLETKVHAYLSENSKGEASLFVGVKGPGGGTARRADLKPATK